MMNSDHASEILEGLYRLWMEERHLDFAVLIDQKSVRCHKVLLAAFSKIVLDKCKQSDSDTVRTIDDPEYLISKLYKWENVCYVDYLSNIVSRAQDLQISVLLSHDKRRAQNSKSEMFVQTLHTSLLQQFANSLATFWKTGILTDMVLIIEDAQIRCHKAILASVSSFFDAMFTSGMREANFNEVHIQGVDKTSMEKILSFLYTGENVIDVSNADTLFSASVFLQMPLLQHKVERFLLQHMDFENSVDILRLGKLCNSVTLQEKAKSFVLKHFVKILKQCQHKYFQLTVEEMSEVLSDSDLCVMNEDVVLDYVFLWFENQTEKQEAMLLSLLECVRLSHVSREKLMDLTDNNTYINQYITCKQYIHSAIDYDSENSKKKQPQRNDEVLLVLQASGYKKGINLACFSFLQHIWYRLPSLSSADLGCSFGTCASGQNIYVTGGSGSPRSFLWFCSTSNTWGELEHMRMGRSAHCSCVVGDNLFVLGGCISTSTSFPSVGKYSFTKSNWTPAGELFEPVANAACSAINNKILIFGGTKSFGEYICDIQCYDTDTESCSVVSKFPKQIMTGFIGVAVDLPTLYMVTANGKVVLFRTNHEPSLIGSIHNRIIMGFATLFHAGNILVLGGSSANFESNDINQFDLAKRKSSTPKAMKLPFAQSSNQYFATVLYVNKQYLTQVYK